MIHPLSYCKEHILIHKVPIKRTHIKVFMLYSGAALMCGDAAFSIFFVEHYAYMEHMIASSGKCGAALAGIACFFEKMS